MWSILSQSLQTPPSFSSPFFFLLKTWTHFILLSSYSLHPLSASALFWKSVSDFRWWQLSNTSRVLADSLFLITYLSWVKKDFEILVLSTVEANNHGRTMKQWDAVQCAQSLFGHFAFLFSHNFAFLCCPFMSVFTCFPSLYSHL